MALTDRSEVFAALNEEGINRLIVHVMRQRPSLFNYGTQFVSDHPELLCEEIDASSMVTGQGNPLLGIVDPLPVAPIGDHLSLNYCLQIKEVEIDFHPASTVSLPPEIGTLQEHQFALRARACGGLGCPPLEFTDTFEVPEDDGTDPEPTVPDVDSLICFCLELVVTGHFEPVREDDDLTTMLRPKLDAVEIVDLAPVGLENAIECYVRLAAQFGVTTQLSDILADIIPELLEGLEEEFELTLVPAPVSGNLTHNPAVENDEVKLFIDIEEVSP